MVFKRVNEISFENAKKAVKVIIDVLNEFLDSIEKIYPNIGYGELVKTLTLLQSNVKLSTGPFLSSTEINENVSLLFEIFSTMNDDLKNNLQKLFEAYREITSFIFSNNANIDVKLLDFQHSRIEDIKINNKHLNDALMKMKDSNYTDETLLRSLFSIFSSIVETSEELHRKELNSHCDKINTFSKSKKLSYIFPYDPIDVFGIGGVVSRKDKKGTYTKQRAIRHLLDHHHFKIDSENHQIHFKSPKNDSKWKFDFDETISFKQFCTYLGIVDAFYKSAVCLLLSFQLLGILREHFQYSLSHKTKLKLRNLLLHLNQHPYLSK